MDDSSSIKSILRRTNIPERAREGRESSSFTELYKECQRNHAAALGWHATDGCNEYIRNTGYPGMYCEACGCHRNFHNKVLVPEQKIEHYQANARQSDNGVKSSGFISENRINCDQGNKKECDRRTKEESLLVQKGFEGNQTNQIQGSSLSTPELAYSPFMIFMNEFKEKLPFENYFCGVALACGQKWKSMTLAERAPYVAMAEKKMAKNIKINELKHKYVKSNSESKAEGCDEKEEDDEQSNEEDDEESYEEEADEESSEEEDDEESYEKEEDDEESSEEDEDDGENSEEEEDEEVSNESNSESNDEESGKEEDGKESNEEVDNEDNDESNFESNAIDNDDDEEEIVFVNLEPDPCISWEGEDGGFELITADSGSGEQFEAPDLSELISKQGTSTIPEDDEDVDETGMPSCPHRTLS